MRADINPVIVFTPVTQGWGAIGCAIEHVQFVGKFMVDNIVAQFRVPASVQCRIPDKDHRAL